jgi:3-oxoacyl-[acyl-carrier protein] reductase
VRCDVTDEQSVDAAFSEVEAELGKVEVLVSNAGITDDTLLVRMSEQSFTSVLDANLTGAYRVAKRATPGMLRARFGRLIFISSVVGMAGGAGQANYAASKAGLIGLARSLARELGSRNITANVIAPGFIETDMTAVLTDERRAEVLAGIPAKRYGSAQEVASAVRFVASDEASYLNGALLPVDGGLAMGI